VKPARALAAGKDSVIEIAYSGKAATEHQGLFKVDGAGPENLPGYFTMFEPGYAQYFYPCNDQPDDKATMEVHAIVDSRYQVLSNGRKDKDEVYADGGKNLRRVSWKQDQPHSTYLLAIAIGAF